jgi:dihydropteroate synthase
MSEPSLRILDCRGRPLGIGGETRLFGILNVTPDSFFDGGRFATEDAAAKQALRMVDEGAAAIDLGGQSTRPGARVDLSAAAEIERVLPVLERLVRELAVPISVDTYKPDVARAALAAGANLINDVRGFQDDPAMATVVAEFGCPVILMHWDRGFETEPGDSIEKIKRYFDRSLAIAKAAGVPEERIVLDPGIGFAKTPAQSLEITGRIGELKTLGLPLLLGISRKSSIGHALGGVPPEDRLEGTLATTVLAVVEGIDFVRVHDVLANFRAARTAEAVLRAKRMCAR